jgi:hypothetical protein
LVDLVKWLYGLYVIVIGLGVKYLQEVVFMANFLSFDSDINPLVSLYLTDNEVRWDKSNRIVWLNDGIKAIRKIRADASLDEWEEIEYRPYNDGDALTILPEVFLDSIVSYIVWKCYLQDSQDDLNMQLAKEWESTYKRGIGE